MNFCRDKIQTSQIKVDGSLDTMQQIIESNYKLFTTKIDELQETSVKDIGEIRAHLSKKYWTANDVIKFVEPYVCRETDNLNNKIKKLASTSQD